MADDDPAIMQLRVLDTEPETTFDDAVALASYICGTPTALVSLLDEDRQWFKARVGFACDQTDLDRSVCRHVVAAARTLVIPDLTLDARTAANPLVTGEPHIRFYAGAPLNTRYGPVGALCVIDTVPRPDGLSKGQRTGLERLARQVVTLLEARRDAIDLFDSVAAHGESVASQKLSERRWRELYRGMDQGFIYARVLRDDAGRIRDWRYEDVNRAWGELVGIDPDVAKGRTIRELIPGIEDEWVMELAQVVETHEPVRFTRQVGVFDRWYDGTAQWVGGDDFTVMFQEVTARVLGEQKRDALLALGDMLRDADSVAEMTSEASRIIGEAVKADRATFGFMDHTRERVTVVEGWSAAGMASAAGEYRFDDYGRIREYLIDGRVVVIDDVAKDPRTSDEAGRWELLAACAVVNVPVREHGRTTSALLVHKREPHHWSTDEIAFLRNAADRVETGIAQRRAEEQQDVVNGEISHRLKNTLAMVQGVAMQTLRKEASAEALDGFSRRLQALGTAHDALTSGRTEAATLDKVVAGVLDAAGVTGRCDLDGPTVPMGARAALACSLLVHELTTNAVKYGSLSSDSGRVAVVWSLEGESGSQEVVLNWTECGGPPAIEPSRRGFGSRLIRLGLIGTGGSTVRYTDQGLAATFCAPLVQVEQA